MASLAAAQDLSPEEVERRIAAGSSIARLIEPAEIAYLVAFVASPKSVAINGDVIPAGGGVGNAIYL
jgi:NAD(P)-dependent dehydrogenase (short-subunit alcohol dehydrogenase family)